MKKNPLLKHHKDIFNRCIELSSAKNHDYATSQDPMSNFRYSEQIGVPMEKGILIRLSDKFSRICQLINKDNEVKDETIEDTLIDNIVYSSILLFALKEKKNGKKKTVNRGAQTKNKRNKA